MHICMCMLVCYKNYLLYINRNFSWYKSQNLSNLSLFLLKFYYSTMLYFFLLKYKIRVSEPVSITVLGFLQSLKESSPTLYLNS